MDTTNSLVVNEDSLDCSNFTFNIIHDLSGIQYFKNLVYLNASGNNLTTIPYIASTLKGLYLGGNVISSLPPLPNTLRELNISGVSAVFTSVYIPSVLPDSLKILSANYTK